MHRYTDNIKEDVNVVLSYRLDDQGILIRSTGRTKDFSTKYQIGSGTHTLSQGTDISATEGKAAGT